MPIIYFLATLSLLFLLTGVAVATTVLLASAITERVFELLVVT